MATSVSGDGPSSSTLFVDMTHLFDRHDVLARAVSDQYYRFLPWLKRAVVRLLREQLLEAWRESDAASAKINSRKKKTGESQEQGGDSQTNGGAPSNEATDGTTTVSANSANNERLRAATEAVSALSSALQIAFHSLPLVSSLRDLRTPSIGTLLSVSGTVTRTSEVRPELVYGAFECLSCGALVGESSTSSTGTGLGGGAGGGTGIGLIEQQFKYTEPSVCPNLTCGNRRSWKLRVEDSLFLDWQKVRIQENAGDIPTGSMPRRCAKAVQIYVFFGMCSNDRMISVALT